MPKVKTAISIENDLLTETTSLAKELDISRSQVVSEALEEYIRNHHHRKMLHQINEAYSEYPDPDEKGTMEIIRSHRKKSGEHDEWK
jgi:metal-responsive CopG/Arc/MetJ family transcriptional regulator